MRFEGVRAIYVDEVEVGLNVYSGTDVLYLDAGRRLTAPPPGDERVVVPPVCGDPPSDSDVVALIERFRMVKGKLPRTVVIPRVVLTRHDPQAVAARREPRSVAVLGYNVLLRGS